MDREERRFLEEFRRSQATPIENNLIDEIVSGDIDRHEFLKRGAMFGLSAGVLSSVFAYVGEASAAPTAASAAARRGGTVRVGVNTWGGSLEPYKIAESGTISVSGITGEFLTYSNPRTMRVDPWLATSWRANKDATVWTFQLRKGVRFHNGREMTADDVVANFKVYAGHPQSQAASVFKNVLTADGVRKKGRYTVEFRLQSPTGAFPYLVSNTSYQCIIYPRSVRLNNWVRSGMIGTGAFKLQRAVNKRQYTFVRNPNYWGGSPALDGVKITVFETSTAQALAMRAGQIDIPAAISQQEAQPFFNDRRFRVIRINTPAHRQFCLRTDGVGAAALKDPRVRRAIGTVINRPQVVAGLLGGVGTLGNDTPFWRGYPSSHPSVKQRTRNVRLARQLLEAAGQSRVSFKVTTHGLQEIPDYAASIQRYAREAGIDVDIDLMSTSEYYGGGEDYYATTPWINKPATITEWGTRAVPNVYLTAAFASDGIWNASHYKNPKTDAAIKSYLTAVDIRTQRKYAKRITGLLLQDTPVVIAYHFTTRTPVNAKLRNYVPDGIDHVFLHKAYFV